jgi:hypothetical protein
MGDRSGALTVEEQSSDRRLKDLTLHTARILAYSVASTLTFGAEVDDTVVIGD